MTNTRLQTRVLKDIIHGYINITPIEKTIVEHRTFQRLRFVGQNSLAYYTYPNNHTDRFSHSLGVMHLGGLMFKKSIENASFDTLKKFLIDANEYLRPKLDVHGEVDEVYNTWNEHIGNIAQINHPILHSGSNVEQARNSAILNIFWQSLRLACLLHDIGHFPFSHLMEYALKTSNVDIDQENKFFDYELSALRNRYDQNILDLNIMGEGQLALHEMNGINLMSSSVRPEVPESYLAIEPLAKICSQFGRIIFVTNKGNYTHHNDNIIRFMHTIVSSEIDADRLDYSVRDPQSSASKLGAIDVARIVNACRLYEDEGKYKIVLGSTALSGIEEFYHQRFLTYKYIIYHHNVQRSDYALVHIIQTLISFYFSSLNDEVIKEIKKILEEYGFINISAYKDGEGMFLSLFPFYHYDDHWLRGMLLRIYDLFQDDEGNRNKLQTPSLNFVSILEVVLFRKMKHVKSMWKRESDIMHDIEIIKLQLEALNIDFSVVLKKEENKKFKNNIERCIIYNLNNITSGEKIKTELKNYFKQKEGITLIIADSVPKIFEDKRKSPEVEILTRREKLVSARKTSFYLDSLKDIAATTIVPRFYFFKNSFRKEYDDKKFRLLTSELLKLLAKKIVNVLK